MPGSAQFLLTSENFVSIVADTHQKSGLAVAVNDNQPLHSRLLSG
jgi:hypothetical protein